MAPDRLKLKTLNDNPYLDTLSKARVQISEPAINFKRAVIILSQRCNLACGYCFAQFAHSNVCMTQDNLSAIIDYIFKDGDDNSISFDIIGGGEPLLWQSQKKH